MSAGTQPAAGRSRADDRRAVLAAPGRPGPGLPDVVEPFVAAGVLGPADAHLAATLARLAPGTPDSVLLAAALALRAPQWGHVCADLAHVATTVMVDLADRGPLADLPWPDPDPWIAEVGADPLVRAPDQPIDASAPTAPLVLDANRCYLARYWHYERLVGDALLSRSAVTDPVPPSVDAHLEAVFGTSEKPAADSQRRVAEVALARRLTVVAGGPGTGKTTTVARLLAVFALLAADAGHPIEVALAAPTGKAAARLTEAIRHAVADVALPEAVASAVLADEAVTVHRLLGARGRRGFARSRSEPLGADVVVVDESSMVSLPLMAHLLDALRPDARLVLVGDPHQLASVEAGTVLGDIVGPAATTPDTGASVTPRATAGTPPGGDDAARGRLADGVVVLGTVHRYRPDSAIAELAESVRRGDSHRALATLADSAAPDLTWTDPDDPGGVAAIHQAVVEHATALRRLAADGDVSSALERLGAHAVLCATRHGPHGVRAWNRRVEAGLGLTGSRLDRAGWYLGRPIMVTANDYRHGLANGDLGVVVATDDGRRSVAFPVGTGHRLVELAQLDRIDTLWAATIHKSQGSEFDHVVVVLPPPPSPVLTRELLYTAITRARRQVTVVAPPEAVRAAVDRPVQRASGLRDRLWPTNP